MLKLVETTELHLGMYIAKISDGYFDSPFWRSSFLLTKEQEIKTLLDHGFTSVWIDASKGIDPDDMVDKLVLAEDSQQAVPEGDLDVVVADEKLAAAPVAENRSRAESFGFGKPLPVSPDEPRPAPLDTERARAAAICGNARRAMVELFQEVRLGNAANAEKMAPVVDSISQSVLRNSDALIGLVRLKTQNDYTYMHSVAVCALMITLARQLGMTEDDVQAAGLAGLLHDIGKMTISNSILNKPASLTDEEMRAMRLHPVSGHRILSGGTGVSEIALDVVLHHHEKMDGSGYPHGLANDQISRFARMGAVCDVYDALTSNRPYKEGWCPSKAVRMMASWKGHFDPVVFQAFVKSVGVYPVGTLVRLESGRLGVVLQQHIGKSLLQPQVKVFFSTKSMNHISPEVIDLAAPHTRDKIASCEDPEKWAFKGLESYWVHG